MIKLFKKIPMPWYKKLNSIRGAYSKSGSGDRFLALERNPEAFVGALVTLSLLRIFVSHQSEISLHLKEADDQYFSKIYNFFVNNGAIDYQQLSGGIKFRSAYAEVLKDREGRRVWQHDENLFTSIPDCFPLAVDYVL